MSRFPSHNLSQSLWAVVFLETSIHAVFLLVRLCVRVCVLSCSVRGGFKALDRFNNGCSCAASSPAPDPSVLPHRWQSLLTPRDSKPTFSSRYLRSFPPAPRQRGSPSPSPSPHPQHPSILPSIISFLARPLLRKWRPDTNTPLPPRFPDSFSASLFLSVWPCFNLSNRTFSLGSPLLLLSSSVHFLVSPCHFEFSRAPPTPPCPLFFISCIPSV